MNIPRLVELIAVEYFLGWPQLDIVRYQNIKFYIIYVYILI